MIITNKKMYYLIIALVVLVPWICLYYFGFPENTTDNFTATQIAWIILQVIFLVLSIVLFMVTLVSELIELSSKDNSNYRNIYIPIPNPFKTYKEYIDQKKDTQRRLGILYDKLFHTEDILEMDRIIAKIEKLKEL